MKQTGNIIIVLVIIAVLAAGLIVYFKSKSPTTPPQPATNTSEQTKTFQSKELKLSLQISNKWQLTEKTTFIDLLSQDGKINISRIATNFNDISSYLGDFDSKRKIDVEIENNMKINNYPSVSRIEILKGGPISQQKVYYIYIDGWVYSISTSSKTLYTDLDQIAQSFKYTPEI